MTTKKQYRAAERIANAKAKKQQRFRDFCYTIAKRRLKNSRSLRTGFCCLPNSLEMSVEEFLSKGQQICGGAAVFFGPNELTALLRNWTCTNRRKPVIFFRDYLQYNFHEDGSYRNTFRRDSGDNPPTSGSVF